MKIKAPITACPERPVEIGNKPIKDLTGDERKIYNRYLGEMREYRAYLDRERSRKGMDDCRKREVILARFHYHEQLHDNYEDDEWVPAAMASLGDDAKRVLTLCACVDVVEERIAVLSGLSVRKVRALIDNLFKAGLLVIDLSGKDSCDFVISHQEFTLSSYIPDFTTESQVDEYIREYFGLAIHPIASELALFDNVEEEDVDEPGA